MRTAGGEQNFAFFSVMGQLVFGLASFVSPLAFSSLMQNAQTQSASPIAKQLLALAPNELPWIGFYFAFSAIFILVLIITRFINIPDIELKSDEKAEGIDVYRTLLKQKEVILFTLGIVAYVGSEASLANWMSQFLQTYHSVSPSGEGAGAVGMFWGLMSIGCLVGLLLLKIIDSKLVLRLFSVLEILCILAALYGSKSIALLAFPACGFFLSVMFSIIFSLALNSLANHHGAFSGILCSGILGGAIMPLIIGSLGDLVGLRASMHIVLLLIGFILSISFWAKPLITNKTINISSTV